MNPEQPLVQEEPVPAPAPEPQPVAPMEPAPAPVPAPAPEAPAVGFNWKKPIIWMIIIGVVAVAVWMLAGSL